MTQPSGTETAVLSWLAEHKSAMLELVRALVDIDSGSYDKAGVDAVGARLRAFLAEHGVAFSVVPNDRFGDAIRAEVNNQANNRAGNGGGGANAPVLLLGHRDTVFPAGEAGRRPFRVADGRGSGPGCCDMKAGVVINAFVLAAFARFAAAPSPITALFTADEEIGSPSSKALIMETARPARAVFNSEPGRPGGGVVTGRKGGKFMRLNVVGKAAHAGNNLADGISAIEEIARKIVKLHALTDLPNGISCNVGTIAGGQTVNTVAPHASAEVDLRYIHPEEGARAFRAVEAIVGEANVPGTTREPRNHRRVRAAGGERRVEALVRALRRLRAGAGTERARACSPAAARTQASRRAPAPRPSARSARSAAAPIRRRNMSRWTRSCRVPRRWRSRSCGSMGGELRDRSPDGGTDTSRSRNPEIGGS